MGITTNIEWCDSTLNLQMGCDGCELWNLATNNRRCYAGVLTERYAGHSKGYPEAFEKPKLFLDRLDDAMFWPDLTGAARKDKTWMNGRPRMVFLDDMGDTFTESLPLDWLAQPYGPMVCPKGHKSPRVQRLPSPEFDVPSKEFGGNRPCITCSAAGCCIQWSAASPLEIMAKTPHVYMLLTKRGRRMREFSESHPLPGCFWPGVSVTNAKSIPRVEELVAVKGGGVKWISCEPLWGSVDLTPYLGPGKVGFVIVGGESGRPSKCNPFYLDSLVSIIAQCGSARIPCFVKQLGSLIAVSRGSSDIQAFPITPSMIRDDGEFCYVSLDDDKGGNPEEWPEWARVRQYPEVPHA